MSAEKAGNVERIAHEAAEWFASHREGSLSVLQQAQFAGWLAESPVHLREYLTVSEAWDALRTSAPWPEDSQDALLETLRASESGNVVALGEVAGRGPPAPKSRRLRRPFLALAASLAVLVPAVLAAAWFLTFRGDVYETTLGEQRSVVLKDGSIVQLNTLTKMIVRFEGHRRHIELPKGEAFFRVAPDRTRPFDVETPFATVRAVGTEFNVYARAESTQVAVVEGKVEVATRPAARDAADGAADPGLPPLQPIALGALETIAISVEALTSGSAVAQPLPSTDAATAWIQRRLVFENERLDRAVAEFNRYNRTQLRVVDAELAGLRISGVFNADDPMVLVRYLERIQYVKVTRAGSMVTLGEGI